MNPVTSVALLASIVVQHAWCLQVIPERAKLGMINGKYVENCKVYVSRYGRKSKYYFNLQGTSKHVWANNISVNLIFYEYLHNEYKRSFVEMHFKFCDLMKTDPYIGQALVAIGVTCPLLAGTHKFNNITIPADNFPNVWPFERCKVDINLLQLPTQDLIVNFEFFFLFKQKNVH